MAPPLLSTGVMAGTVVGVRSLIGGGLPPIETMAVLAAAGAAGYGVTLVLGERVGLWPVHVSIRDTLFPRRVVAPISES